MVPFRYLGQGMVKYVRKANWDGRRRKRSKEKKKILHTFYSRFFCCHCHIKVGT